MSRRVLAVLGVALLLILGSQATAAQGGPVLPERQGKGRAQLVVDPLSDAPDLPVALPDPFSLGPGIGGTHLCLLQAFCVDATLGFKVCSKNPPTGVPECPVNTGGPEGCLNMIWSGATIDYTLQGGVYVQVGSDIGAEAGYIEGGCP